MAETVRFELTVPLARYDALARRWIRPLSHVSIEALGIRTKIRNGGGHRIRTCGTFRFNGFQNRRNRPLCQSSAYRRCHTKGFGKKRQAGTIGDF